jgi:hypothetical protein
MATGLAHFPTDAIRQLKAYLESQGNTEKEVIVHICLI